MRRLLKLMCVVSLCGASLPVQALPYYPDLLSDELAQELCPLLHETAQQVLADSQFGVAPTTWPADLWGSFFQPNPLFIGDSQGNTLQGQAAWLNRVFGQNVAPVLHALLQVQAPQDDGHDPFPDFAEENPKLVQELSRCLAAENLWLQLAQLLSTSELSLRDLFPGPLAEARRGFSQALGAMLTQYAQSAAPSPARASAQTVWLDAWFAHNGDGLFDSLVYLNQLKKHLRTIRTQPTTLTCSYAQHSQDAVALVGDLLGPLSRDYPLGSPAADSAGLRDYVYQLDQGDTFNEDLRGFYQQTLHDLLSSSTSALEQTQEALQEELLGQAYLNTQIPALFAASYTLETINTLPPALENLQGHLEDWKPVCLAFEHQQFNWLLRDLLTQATDLSDLLAEPGITALALSEFIQSLRQRVTLNPQARDYLVTLGNQLLTLLGTREQASLDNLTQVLTAIREPSQVLAWIATIPSSTLSDDQQASLLSAGNSHYLTLAKAAIVAATRPEQLQQLADGLNSSSVPDKADLLEAVQDSLESRFYDLLEQRLAVAANLGEVNYLSALINSSSLLNTADRSRLQQAVVALNTAFNTVDGFNRALLALTEPGKVLAWIGTLPSSGLPEDQQASLLSAGDSQYLTLATAAINAATQAEQVQALADELLNSTVPNRADLLDALQDLLATRLDELLTTGIEQAATLTQIQAMSALLSTTTLLDATVRSTLQQAATTRATELGIEIGQVQFLNFIWTFDSSKGAPATQLANLGIALSQLDSLCPQSLLDELAYELTAAGTEYSSLSQQAAAFRWLTDDVESLLYSPTPGSLYMRLSAFNSVLEQALSRSQTQLRNTLQSVLQTGTDAKNEFNFAAFESLTPYPATMDDAYPLLTDGIVSTVLTTWRSLPAWWQAPTLDNWVSALDDTIHSYPKTTGYPLDTWKKLREAVANQLTVVENSEPAAEPDPVEPDPIEPDPVEPDPVEPDPAP